MSEGCDRKSATEASIDVCHQPVRQRTGAILESTAIHGRDLRDVHDRVALHRVDLGGNHDVPRQRHEIREIEPANRWLMSTAQGPFPMETIYEWEDAGAGVTWMTLRNRGEPAGFAALSAPFMARAMRRANQADLRRLKALLEACKRRAPRSLASTIRAAPQPGRLRQCCLAWVAHSRGGAG